jgi:hypothetical protein
MTKAWEQALDEDRHSVLDRWSAAAAAQLTGGSSSPVAEALAAEFGRLIEALAGGNPVDEPLVRFTRILAVQELPPSKALSLIFALLPLVDGLTADGRDRFRDRLDELALQAFDSFMKHRETLYQLKVDEGRRQMHMALRRAEA